MKYFLLSQNIEANEGYIEWSAEADSENTKSTPAKDYWPDINTDRSKTGPIDQTIRNKIKDYYLLTKHTSADVPDSLGGFSSERFTGNPVISSALKNCIEENIIGEYEFIQIENFWSIPDRKKIEEPYYYMNIYDQCNFFDIEKSSAKEIPDFGQSATHYISDLLITNFKIINGAKPEKDIFRDTSTNYPICSSKFVDILNKFNTKSVLAENFKE